MEHSSEKECSRISVNWEEQGVRDEYGDGRGRSAFEGCIEYKVLQRWLRMNMSNLLPLTGRLHRLAEQPVNPHGLGPKAGPPSSLCYSICHWSGA